MMIPEYAQNFVDGYLDFLNKLKDNPEISKNIEQDHIMIHKFVLIYGI